MTGINAVLFDLDGTLVDTAPDMIAALNRLLEHHGRPALPFAGVRNRVSKGSLALVQLAFGEAPGENGLKTLQNEFLDTYAGGLCKHSRLFDGMAALLDTLDTLGILWGVVTNKPAWLTEPLLRQLDLHRRCACIVSGDTVARRKPHPEPLLLAAGRIRRAPAQCVFIGDDRRDVEAGRAAGMRTVVAEYGYIEAGESPQHWGADAMMASVEQLHHWLKRNIR